jgi:hypothetical protein
MAIAWFLNIIGLFVSTYGAFLMSQYPLQAARFDENGERINGKEPPAAPGRRNYKAYKFWSKWALYLLVIGFFFQLIGTFLAFVDRFWI